MHDVIAQTPIDRSPRVPPAPEWRYRQWEQLGGIEMLRELPDGATSLALWSVLRSLDAWTELQEDRRDPLPWPRTSPNRRLLLRQAQDENPDLKAPLATFARRGSSPHKIAIACARIVEWAEERSHLQTAAYFAEAAAYADRDVARWHRGAGRLCRRVGLYQRAELWFRRGFHLAVKEHSRTEAVRTLLGYGKVLQDQGLHNEARMWLGRAAKRARWTGRPRYAAEAHHDLALLEAEDGSVSLAVEHFLSALQFYARSSPRVPYLVHDAAFLLIRRRHYSDALAILEHVITKIQRPEERILVWGSLGRAAASACRRERFHQAELEVSRLADRHAEHAATAFIHLAEGARAIAEWETALRYAAHAAELAASRSDELIRRDATALAAVIEHQTAPPRETEPTSEKILELIRLCRWKLRTWRQRPQLPDPKP